MYHSLRAILSHKKIPIFQNLQNISNNFGFKRLIKNFELRDILKLRKFRKLRLEQIKKRYYSRVKAY